ncbi:MAG: LysR family transcriptional regulator [Pseudomonadota bacterium]
MARNLDLAALRSFIAVAETGGVTRAAQRLHLTQSGVSMQLKRLEGSLDAELLSRDGRGVTLTKLGEELLSNARKMIALNDEIVERMRRAPLEGELTLGMPHDIVYPLAPRVLRRFNADFPGVRVNLVSPPSSELIRAHQNGEIDVILTTEEGAHPGAETLTRRCLVWVGAPSGRAWRKRPAPVATDPRCAFRKPSFEALDRAGVGWEWAISTGSSDAIIATIAADLGICALLKGTAPAGLEEIDHGGALPDLPMINVNLYVGANIAKEQALTDQLASYVREAFQSTDPLRNRAVRQVA